ncbi:MAG: hypothetical protein L6271_14310 [Desulfobacteraceae bacterium]|nr:hypothetical protein [Desulfobacteraceae bacterium]
MYYYNEDKREFTLNSWSREVMQECTIVEPKTCYQLDTCGLWGEVVRQLKPILVNDYQAENLQDLYPELKILFMSGYTADIIAHNGILNESANFIQKPFSTNDLAIKVREALEGE